MRVRIHFQIHVSTHICESLFSTINYLKPKQKNNTLSDELNATCILFKHLRRTQFTTGVNKF